MKNTLNLGELKSEQLLKKRAHIVNKKRKHYNIQYYYYVALSLTLPPSLSLTHSFC